MRLNSHQEEPHPQIIAREIHIAGGYNDIAKISLFLGTRTLFHDLIDPAVQGAN